MALLEGKTPAERNKTIAALVLGLIAVFFVGRMLFGGGSSGATQTARNTNTRKAGRATANTNVQNANAADEVPEEALIPPQPIVFNRSMPDAPPPGRNIFAFYTPPAPTAKPTSTAPTEAVPEVTLAPPPPLMLASLAPTNVFARTDAFTLQATGDKFTPATRIYVDGQELPTRFVSPQQLSADVPAALITAPGARQIIVRTPDNQLYSNAATLNVAAPPAPSYTYIGIIGTKRPGISDTAVLKDQKGELLSVQRGDLVGGRFRVTAVSERTIEFTDQQLKIKHTLPFTENRGASPSGPQRYVPPPPKPDEEPVEEPEL